MMMVYSNTFDRIGILSNDFVGGIKFERDELTTTLDNGLYTLSFVVRKTDKNISVITEGNYIETYTIHGKKLLMMIDTIRETGSERYVHCEDSSIKTLNSYVDPIELPTSPQRIDYYLNHALEKTNHEIRLNESADVFVLEFTSVQRILERLREVVKAFGMEFSVDIEFAPGSPPRHFLNIYQKRVEDLEGFRVSSLDLLYGVERTRSILNIATMVSVRGKEIPAKTGGTDDGVTTPSEDDASWSPAFVDRRNKALGGQSNDRSRDVITHGAIHFTAVERTLNRTIESHENFWANEHGWTRGGYHFYIDSQATVFWNYNYETRTNGVYGNNDYTVHVCLEGNAPTNFSTAQLKARDWVLRKIMRELSVPAGNIWQHKEFPMNEDEICSGYTLAEMNAIRNALLEAPSYADDVPGKDSVVEAAITEAHRLAALRLPYQWGGNGDPSYDCSGFCQRCYEEAGVTISHRATTHSMWAEYAPFKRISLSELRRGDLIMIDNGLGQQPAPNHVAIYLGPTLDAPNSMIHAGNPVGITQRANSMTIVGYVRVLT